MSFELYRTQLLKSLHTLKMSMDRFLESIVQSEGLTALQAMLLMLISEGFVNNVSSLCKEIGITQSNASALCKKLEKCRSVTVYTCCYLSFNQHSSDIIRRLHSCSYGC